MEPMTLGSAPSSPTAGPTGFLPSYLMGEHESSTPKQTGFTSSPLNRNHVYNLSTSDRTISSPISKQRPVGPSLFDPTLSESPSTNTNKPGPPTASLFDTLEDTRQNSSYAIHNDSYNCNTPSASFLLNTSHLPPNESNWVTVFGFAPDSLNLVLNTLANHVTVVDKRIPLQANWINVKLSSRSEVAKALSLNGLVISNNIMIGVMPYREKHNQKENIDVVRTVYSSPVGMRSLKHSFASPHSSDTVLTVQNVPQKSTGIVTKAMEYVFGW